MSARLPAAIRSVALALAVAASASAHGLVRGAGKVTIYANDAGQTIVLTEDAVTIGNATHPLRDCSDAQFVCKASDAGFHVQFPRRCPRTGWFPSSGPMKFSYGFAHAAGGNYSNRAGSPFLYEWQSVYGLTSIAYDPTKDFAALPAQYLLAGPTVYARRSGPRRYRCTP
ncbi:MAG TPA: hypothetical protein VGD66_03995 [Allosphingosinicella sp.]|jgi:hypothetical protein